MNNQIEIYKERCKGKLYLTFLIRVDEALKKSKKDYITYRHFSEKICRCFSIPKPEAIENSKNVKT